MRLAYLFALEMLVFGPILVLLRRRDARMQAVLFVLLKYLLLSNEGLNVPYLFFVAI